MVNDIFLNKVYSSSYPFTRKINKKIFGDYMEKIIEHLKDKKTFKILDVGCGTGQFTSLLSNYFDYKELEVEIDGVDSSPEMLKVAEELTRNDRNIKLIESDILSFKPKQKYDLIFSSEMIHLVDDTQEFFERLNNLISMDGVIAIRTSTHKQLYEREWYKYFPGTLLIDITRHKSSYEIKATLESLGFILKQYEIDESEQINSREYLNIFENRSYSTLRLIPDSIYYESLNKLRKEVLKTDTVIKDYKMTLYIAGKEI
ncbi:class I SAM-dependent methyltransferase [Pontibacillus marinus]|uniref:Methyltransferase domain-containing protein n=1 Tax=Pontibacillus marinus BH030004 = DSM 16465 TaxID=1385511 RepID=A0A0A5GGE4_9BACI|nr:class I SAM-dependent methyltransferase [Pontibacillus marinus]KGX91044.1 hypothetical protein N783_13595 [Pontibacillus marinus BH030004 = DSM 16465]